MPVTINGTEVLQDLLEVCQMELDADTLASNATSAKIQDGAAVASKLPAGSVVQTVSKTEHQVLVQFN